ncbi:hypothetical protein QFZ30_003072 [Arthrobacter pascens]|uniref:hypothetical protein n=1 Tax=Arthrobacter pascens TaxID=1677 RepID=UPI0027941B4F|nr:hypothetical protein [Arthrobacter pascens]MDQ0679690.1 hypothetical protein [Arthrobacter pascens]
MGDYLEGNDLPADAIFAHECRIRDMYASRLREFRPTEKLLKTEYKFDGSFMRADMRTVDISDILRVWEFKLIGSYEGLGQLLTYIALARLAEDFSRPVKGVFAAFGWQPEVKLAVEVLNLGVELVTIPAKLRLAGGVPTENAPMSSPPVIPFLPNQNMLSEA